MPGPGPVRADARRNRETVLAAARTAFAEQGTEASLRDVARRAGVGIGTLYRHFPTREALLEAMLGDDFDRLRARAEELAEGPPRAGLLTWLRELAAGQRAVKGLPDSVMAALRDEDSGLHASCQAMRDAGGRLLRKAQDAGDVRTDLTPGEMLALVAGAAWASGYAADPDAMLERLVGLATEGIGAR